MSDWGRIHRKFHSHPKVAQNSLAAIGLWTMCNSYARDNRTRGFVADEVANGFDPDGLAAEELVASRLWRRDTEKGGYWFHDWSQWNSDEEPKAAAAKLVHDIVQGHPNDVMQRLQQQVSDLLIEGTEWKVVEAALKLWLTKDRAGPSMLPLLVSDVLRSRSDGELLNALRQAWATGSTAGLARYGLVFTPPDIPRDVIGPESVRVFMRDAVRNWINEIRQQKGIIT